MSGRLFVHVIVEPTSMNRLRWHAQLWSIGKVPLQLTEAVLGYSTLIGVLLHPHVCRHSMAKQFLTDNSNDLVSLPQIRGPENLQTNSGYSRRSRDQMAEGMERLTY